MQRYTPMADLKEFHSTFAPDQIYDDTFDKTQRRINLITEEFNEVIQAIGGYRQVMLSSVPTGNAYRTTEELAKELADLLYVVYGTAEEFDIPLEQVFRVVHKSNMSKAEPDGTVKRNEFGKVLKPSTYTPPDLSFIHDNQFLSKSS